MHETSSLWFCGYLSAVVCITDLRDAFDLVS